MTTNYPPTSFCLNFLNNTTSNNTSYVGTVGTSSLITKGSASTACVNWTIEAWIKVPVSGYNNRGAIAGSDRTGFSIYLANTDPPRLQAGLSSTTYENTTDLNDDKWHYVAATVAANGTGTYYIDGKATNTFTQGAPGVSYTDPWLIGGRTVNSNTNNFIGQITEVRVWNTALPSAFITANWNTQLPTSINQNGSGGIMNSYGLIAYYSNFDKTLTSNGILNCLVTGPTLTASQSYSANNIIISSVTIPTAGNPSDILYIANALDFTKNTKGTNLSYFSCQSDLFRFNTTTPSWSIEAWIYLPSSVTYDGFMGMVGSNNTYFCLALSGKCLTVQGAPDDNVQLTLDKWHYVAVSVNGYNLNYYTDNTGPRSVTYNTQGGGKRGYDLAFRSNPFIIGTNDFGQTNGQNFLGKITEIRVWNIALSSTQITTQWYGKVHPSSLGLIAYYSNFSMNQQITNGSRIQSLTPFTIATDVSMNASINTNKITISNPTTKRNQSGATNYKIGNTDINTLFDNTITTSNTITTGYNVTNVDISNSFTSSTIFGTNTSISSTNNKYNVNNTDLGSYFSNVCPIPPPVNKYTTSSIDGGGYYWKCTSSYKLFSNPPINDEDTVGYEVIQILTSGTIIFPFDYTCKICMVGGGGGTSCRGGGYGTGGGGGGGVAEGTFTFKGGKTYTLTIGSGGNASNNSSNPGDGGTSTSITCSTPTVSETVTGGGGGGKYDNPYGGFCGTYTGSLLTGHGGYIPPSTNSSGWSSGAGAGGNSKNSYGGLGYLWPITNNYYGGGGGVGIDNNTNITSFNDLLTYTNSGGWGGGGYGYCVNNTNNNTNDTKTTGAGNALDGYGGGGGGGYGRCGIQYNSNPPSGPNAAVPGGSGGIYIAIPNDPTFTKYWLSKPTFHYMFNDFVSDAWPNYKDWYNQGGTCRVKNIADPIYLANPNYPSYVSSDGISSTSSALTQSTYVPQGSSLDNFNMGKTASIISPNINLNNGNSYTFKTSNSGLTVCFWINIRNNWTTDLEILNITWALDGSTNYNRSIRLIKTQNTNTNTNNTSPWYSINIRSQQNTFDNNVFSTQSYRYGNGYVNSYGWQHISIICTQNSSTQIVINGGNPNPYTGSETIFTSGYTINSGKIGLYLTLGSSVDAYIADFRLYETVLTNTIINKFIYNFCGTNTGDKSLGGGNYGDGWLSNNFFTI